MTDKNTQLAALAAAAEGGFSAPLGGPPDAPGEVLCRVCDTYIDAATGNPTEPVGPQNVEAVRQYISEAGQAEEGGVALV